MVSTTRRLYTAITTGTIAVASSFAVTGPTPSFVVAPIDALVVAYTPSALVTWAIVVLGSLGAQLGFVLATLLAVTLFGAVAAIADRSADRHLRGSDADLVAVGTGAVLDSTLAYALTRSLVSALAVGVGVGAMLVAIRWIGPAFSDESETLADGKDTPTDRTVSERRRFLASLVGVVGFVGVSAVLGTRTADSERPARTDVFDRPAGDGGQTRRAAVERRLAEAREKSIDVEGMPSLTSEIGEFYQVDINSIDPDVDAADWSLSFTGAVSEPMTVDYDALVDLDAEQRFVTLRCVGESLNGQKMDSALWTGVPVDELLETATPEGEYVMVRAVDGYYEGFPLAALENAFLAYGMNGELLPRSHGYPVRLLVPGHWGEINVKWIDEIEVLVDEEQGYWEKRGWHGTGPVNTVAKLWAENRRPDGRFEVAGHAYAGTRGIESVEVSVDGGSTWNVAELSEPLPDVDVWRQWRYVFEPEANTVEVVVRARDGTGTLQPKAEAQPFPSGATGWVAKSVRTG